MSTNKANRYDEDFKRTLVELYHNGKTQASLVKEYGVSQTALTKWINRKRFHNQDELRLTCFEYIQRYNSKRPHNSLGGYTPNEVEDFYMERQE